MAAFEVTCAQVASNHSTLPACGGLLAGRCCTSARATGRPARLLLDSIIATPAAITPDSLTDASRGGEAPHTPNSTKSSFPFHFLSCRSEVSQLDRSSDISTPDLAAVEEVVDLLENPEPVLDVRDGQSQSSRVPPKAWLVAAGYQLSSGSAFHQPPSASSLGERSGRYQDLFARQMLARERREALTAEALWRHDCAMCQVRHSDKEMKKRPSALPSNGQSLAHWIVEARARPVRTLAASIVGADLGDAVAAFLDSMSDTSADVEVDHNDVPNGEEVSGQRIVTRPVQRGRGRAGFEIREESGITLSGRSMSPAPQRGLGNALLGALSSLEAPTAAARTVLVL